jgi:hypothetical protein
VARALLRNALLPSGHSTDIAARELNRISE